MKKLLVLLICLIVQVAPAAPAQEPSAGSDPLALHVKNFALDFDAAPLTQVLSRLTAAAGDGFLLFGVEVVVHQGKEPLVTAHVPARSTLREALTIIFRSAPDYEFVAAAPHLVNVLPRGSLADANDLLNLTVPDFDLANVAPTNFLASPARFIPQLKLALEMGQPRGCTIGPGLSDKAPGMTLHLPGSTLREDLNLVAEASIDSAARGAGFASGWLYFRETSPSKLYPAHVWRAGDVLSAKQMVLRQANSSASP